jgi:2-methylcitrate dehydratase PrpD
MSEVTPVTGPAALSAFVLGFEVETRVALAAGPAHYDVGWHVTATSGHLGAAAAAARTAGLDARATLHAIGAGATQAAGLRAMAGSDLKSLHPAKAAHDGVLSALLARAGLTTSDRPLEGDYGYLDVMTADPNPDRLTADLGRTWNLPSNGHKLYPSGSLTHPMIDAVIELAAATDQPLADIVRITARVSPQAAKFTDVREPTTGMQAKFSLTHCAAAAAVFRRVGPRELDSEVVADPELADVRQRVTIISDASMGKQDAAVDLELRDGRRLSREVRGNRGTSASPLTDTEIEQKFRALVEPGYGAPTASLLLDACWDVDGLDDLRRISALSAGIVHA